METKKNEEVRFECLGDVVVDSGCVLFADPCHAKVLGEAFEASPEELLETAEEELPGVVIRTTLGDGIYPVMGEFIGDRLHAVTIVLTDPGDTRIPPGF